MAKKINKTEVVVEDIMIEEARELVIPTPELVVIPNTIEELYAMIIELRTELEALKTSNVRVSNGVRNRGPESTKDMTDDDARKCMIGEFAKLSHRDAAEKLGLSYGQVYSARGGYTFKPIYAEMIKIQKESK